MSSSPHTASAMHQGYTPEAELDALATIYRRAVERYEEANVKEKGGPETAPDDAKGLRNDRATDIIPR